MEANRIYLRDSVYGVGLLSLAVVRHYGYTLASLEDRAWVWNVTGSAIMLALVVALARHLKSRAVWIVVAVWAWEELQVMSCGVAWLIHPWPILAGMDTCSSWSGVTLAKISAALAAVALYATCKD
jgi:hypothetical protein